LAAPLISSEDFETLCWHCNDNVPFNGSVISFFENAFEGLTLKDGEKVYP
jgi:hypothetical protein